MSLASLDLNCDGIYELVIVTMYGVTVMQPNLELALSKLKKIKKFLAENQQGN